MSTLIDCNKFCIYNIISTVTTNIVTEINLKIQIKQWNFRKVKVTDRKTEKKEIEMKNRTNRKQKNKMT